MLGPEWLGSPDANLRGRASRQTILRLHQIGHPTATTPSLKCFSSCCTSTQDAQLGNGCSGMRYPPDPAGRSGSRARRGFRVQ